MSPTIPGVEIEEKIVRTTDGYNLSVKCAGPVDGRPILFLHGFPEFWYGWKKQIPYFESQGYRVVVPDQRGYNDSDKPERINEYSLVQLAEDVTAIVRQLKLDNCVLVGHDWGAAVAWQVVIRHPSLFSKLIILNVPHPRVMVKTVFTNIKQFLKSWYMFFFQIPFFPEWLVALDGYRRFAEGMRDTSNPGSFTDEDMNAYISSWKKPQVFNSMLNWYRALFRHGELPSSEIIEVPTLILWGEKDVALEPVMATESGAYCRTAIVKYFPNATHWVQHDESDAVNQEIENFIAGNN